EAANRVGLPVGGFHQILQGGSAGPFQQVEDLGRLAPLAGVFALFTGLSTFFQRGSLLAWLGRLGRNVRLSCRGTGLVGGFQLFSRRGLGGSLFLGGRC